MKTNYKTGDELELAIEKIVPRGLGLGFAEGLTVFVALAAAGDRVRVSLREVKGRTAFAEITEILSPGPERTAPPCPYFGECGGCDFMHLNYQAQLAAKVAMIRDCLERIAKLETYPEIKVIESSDQFRYRLRAQWHADPATGRIGYYRRNSRDLVDVKECIVLVPELQAELDRQRAKLSPATAIGTVQIDAAAGDDGTVSVVGPDTRTVPTISVSAAGEQLEFSAATFFQGNRSLVDALVETAIGGARGSTALDLYCGVGLFTLPLARRFSNVIGVEESELAIEFANENAQRAGLENIELYAASVREYLASGEAPQRPDLVLLDPPRAGTEKDTIMNLIGLEPAVVSYVACEPSILARDLKRFVENGYELVSITAIDLFPQTHHVETIARLVRRAA